jgi:hypothetical protein
LAKSNKLHASLSAFGSAGTPPLALGGGEGSHGEDKTVSHWKKERRSSRLVGTTIQEKGPDGPFVTNCHNWSEQLLNLVKQEYPVNRLQENAF